ncbi:hypothetical protein DRP04_12520 [Archaeoglobales archaeon]|nr:MAG: hypothetical protein DRP04_12520 [Archaeoglobales archaeon]
MKRRKDAIISIRIPENLKKEMESVDINWSEFVRNAIEEKIRLEKLRRISKEIDSIKEQIKKGGVESDS